MFHTLHSPEPGTPSIRVTDPASTLYIRLIFHEGLADDWFGLFVRFSSPFFLFPIFIKESCASGETAIDVTKACNYTNIVDILAKCVESKRSDPMRSTSHVQAVAHPATQLDIRNTCHIMGNINDGTVGCESPLVAAIEGKNLEKVKLLLECGAVAGKTDKDGKTFLVVLLSCFKSS